MSTITKLKGLTALITGGAGQLGRGAVDRFVQQGARVVICDLPSSDGNIVAAQHGDDVTFCPTDVTCEDDVKCALSVTKEKYGGLDVTVNCHGVAVSVMSYNITGDTLHDLEHFHRLQNVNLVGSFNVIRLAAQMMSENTPNADGQRGVIVNTGSVSGSEGMRAQSAFSASQGGIAGMTLPIARDLASIGIRINTIALGFFDTKLLSHSWPERVKAYVEGSILSPSRFGTAEEYAHAVQFVIENPMMNGATFRLDAGTRMMFDKGI